MYQITRTAITRAVLALTFIALTATAQADPRNQSGPWKLNGNGYPGDVTVQQAADGRLSGSIYGERIIGFYASGERVGVWLRVPAGLEPMQAFVGEASADGLNFSGRLYALTTFIAGGSSERNVFSFKARRAAPGATPAVVPSDPGVLPPAPAQQGPDSVAGTYQIRGNGSPGTMVLNQAADGALTGTIYGQRLDGHYASGTGSIAFIRSSSGAGVVSPYQLFVGTVTPQGGLRGDFYALSSAAGASMARMKYSWTSWRGTGAPVAAYFTSGFYSDRLTSTRTGPAVFETQASGSEPIDYFWTVDGVRVDSLSTSITGGKCNGATVSFPRRDRMELSNLPSTCHKVLVTVAIENPGTTGALPTRTVLLQLDGMPPAIPANITRESWMSLGATRSVTVVPYGNVEFAMQAEGDLPITYLWNMQDGSGNTPWLLTSPTTLTSGPCSGTRVTFPPQMPLPQMNMSQSVLRLENLPLTCNGAWVYLAVTNIASDNRATSINPISMLNVVVPTPVSFTSALASPQTVEQGQSIDIAVTATGTLPINYRWTIDNMSISTSPGLAHPPTVSAGRCQGATVLFPTPNVMRLGNVPLSCDSASIGVQLENIATVPGSPITIQRVTLNVTPALPLPIPANALTATQIVAGNEWSMALRPDRTVWAWGSGQWTTGTVAIPGVSGRTDASRPTQMYPSVLTDVRAISGWNNSFWALKGSPGSASSRVLHWGVVNECSDGRGSNGQNASGNCNPTRFNNAPQEMYEDLNGILRPVDRVCAIAGGGGKLIMIRAINNTGAPTNCDAGSAKTVWYVGSLGGSPSLAATSFIQKMPGLPSNSPPAVIFAGQTTSGSPPLVIALEDGRIYALGDNSVNSGLGVAAASVGNSNGPLQLPANWGSARLFGMSFYSSLFVVRADGSVLSNGIRDSAGELGSGYTGDGSLRPWSIRGPCSSYPCEVLTGVTAIASTSSSVTLALENGRILGWGANNSPGLRGPNVGFNSPLAQVVPSTVSGFTALSASHTHALVIGPGNVVYAWGSNQRGALGNGTSSGQRTAPEMVTTGP